MIKHLKYLSVFAGIVFCLGCAQAASGDEGDSDEEKPKSHKLKKVPKGKATVLDKKQPLAELGDALDDDETPSKIVKKAAKKPTAPAYDPVKEYRRHKDVSNRFFRREAWNKNVKKAVKKFEKELANGEDLTQIDLDGLSSRARILLLKDLTTCAEGRKVTIPLQLREKEFRIELNPKPRQPGNGGVIEKDQKYGKKHEEIHAVLSAQPGDQKAVAPVKLVTARKANHSEITDPVINGLDLEMLNVLLDFEVARRLQDGDDYLDLPVASAVVGALTLPAKGTPFESFFHAPNTIQKGAIPFRYGPLNAFQGDFYENHRETAVKEIIKKLRDNGAAGNSSREDIHQEYLEIFGGETESEGNPYADSATSAGEDDD